MQQHEGFFDLLRSTTWNQHRSRLSHTDFGNGILGYWTDAGRWPEVLGGIDSEDTAVWNDALCRWPSIREELIAHAERIFGALPKIADELQMQDLLRLLHASRGRYHDWCSAVRSAVRAVDTALNETPPTRASLERLAEAGRVLQDTYSGKGWFQHGQSA